MIYRFDEPMMDSRVANAIANGIFILLVPWICLMAGVVAGIYILSERSTWLDGLIRKLRKGDSHGKDR